MKQSLDTRTKLLTKNPISLMIELSIPVMLAGIGDLLYGLSVYALQFLLRGRLGLGTYLYRIILPEIFYTVILTLIVYRVFHYINYHFMKNPSMKESESIWVLK